MPVTVKFDNTTQCPQQAQIIPDATPFNDGVMTKAQAAKLAGLTPSGGGECCPNVTDVKTANYNAVEQDVIQCDTSGGGFNINFPAITAGNVGKTITVWISTPEAANAVTVFPTGLNTINGGGSDSFDNGARTYMSNGNNTWMKISQV